MPGARRAAGPCQPDDRRRADRRLGGGLVGQGPGGLRRGVRRRRSTTRTRSPTEPLEGLDALGRPRRAAVGRRSPTRGWSGPASGCTDGRFVAAPEQAAGHPPRAAGGAAGHQPVHRRALRLLLRARSTSGCCACARSSTSTTPPRSSASCPARGTLGEKALLMLRGFGLRRGGGDGVRIAIPIFDGLTALDAVGPYEVLSRLPGARSSSWPPSPGPKRTENGMLALTRRPALSELPDPDVLVFPGGFGTPRADDRRGDARMGARRRTRRLGVDDVGLHRLAAARRGGHARRAAGDDPLAGAGDCCAARRRARLASGSSSQGKLITAAGVSSGIDMALTLAAQIAGDDGRPGDPARHRVRPRAAV